MSKSQLLHTWFIDSVQSQTSACGFVDTDKLIVKFIWRSKRPRRVNTILKENKVGVLTLANFKTYNQFVNIHKITYWGFNWDYIESIGQFGKKWHPGNNVSSCLPAHYGLYSVLWFLSSVVCSFLHIDLRYILLNLYLSISF